MMEGSRLSISKSWKKKLACCMKSGNYSKRYNDDEGSRSPFLGSNDAALSHSNYSLYQGGEPSESHDGSDENSTNAPFPELDVSGLLEDLPEEYAKSVSRPRKIKLRDMRKQNSKKKAPKVTAPSLYKKEDRGVEDIKCSPLIEVFSVNILSRPSDYGKETCEVYGQITVLDGEGTLHCLFDRDQHNPEAVCSGGTLSLTGPTLAPLSMNATLMEVKLKDRKASGAVIADESFLLEERAINECERVITKQIHGEHRFFSCVNYAVLPAAVSAFVEVTFESGEAKSLPPLVFGSITASYGTTFQPLYCTLPPEFVQSRLFNKPSNAPQPVVFGTPLELSRYLVSVPACGSLKIELDLFDSRAHQHRSLLRNSVEFNANYCSRYEHVFTGENVRVRVVVRWLYLQRLYELLQREKNETIEDDNDTEEEELGCHESTLGTPTITLLSLQLMHGLQLIEVYSIFIGRDKADTLSLWGNITNSLEDIDLFRRSEDDPEVLLPCSRRLPLLSYPYCFRARLFRMKFDLEDTKSSLVIKGELCHDEMSSLLVHNTRMCSVIRGVHGFAAVHYTVFTAAVQAMITVKVLCVSPGTSVYISGSMMARYSKEEYPSRYEREYFQNVLFLNYGGEDKVLIPDNHELPLNKYVVCVPINSSMFVDVDLTLSSHSSQVPKERLTEILELKIDMSGRSRCTILGVNYFVTMYVTWSLPNSED